MHQIEVKIIETCGSGGIPGKYDYSVKTGLELYDLRADIGETTDVAEAHPEVVALLEGLADRARADLGDQRTGDKGAGRREPLRLPDAVTQKPRR